MNIGTFLGAIVILTSIYAVVGYPTFRARRSRNKAKCRKDGVRVEEDIYLDTPDDGLDMPEQEIAL